MTDRLAGMQEQDHTVRATRLDDGPHRALIRYVEPLPVGIEFANAAKAQSRAAPDLLSGARIARRNRAERHNLAMPPQSF